MYGLVYLITNLVTGKQYVGQSTALSRPLRRWRRHVAEANRLKSTHPLHRSIRKNGVSSFSVETIYYANNKDELDAAEDAFILLYRTMVPNGYNMKRGGAYGQCSSELKKKFCLLRGTQEYKITQSIAQTIAQNKPSVKRKHREAVLKAHSDPATIDKRHLVMTSDEYIQKQKSSQIHAWRDPVIRQRRIFGLKNALQRPSVQKKKSLATSRLVWITDGNVTRRIDRIDAVPAGWSIGRGSLR